MKVYRAIAQAHDAMLRCEATNNREWREKHRERIERLTTKFLPSGGGFDNGTKFDFDASKPDKLVFTFGFHHLNDNGFYDGWTYHSVIVRPSLAFGVDLRITGSNRNDIKDYAAECFEHTLMTEIGDYTA